MKTSKKSVLANKGLLICLLAVIGFTAQAEIYKWTDAQGRVHYGDRPGGDNAQAMPVAPAPEATGQTAVESAAQRAQRRQRMLDIYREERAEKEAAREQARQELNKTKENCRRARLEYDRFSKSRLIYDYEDNGERRYLSDKEREGYVESLRQAVERWCGR
jgi:hypothetical protein